MFRNWLLNSNLISSIPNRSLNNGSAFNKDFLNVVTTNKVHPYNYAYYFKIPQSDIVNFKNKPFSWTTLVYGYRKVIWLEENVIAVEIVEYYPVPGKRYVNFINVNNGAWIGWKTYLPS